MTGVLSGLGWLLLVTAAVVGIALLPDWLKHYYGQPEEPALLDAPHAAEQAWRTALTVDADAEQASAMEGGA